MGEIKEEVMEKGRLAREASLKLMSVPSEKKDGALREMADSLEDNADFILTENEKDQKRAEGKISGALLDRLRLNTKRINQMASGIREIAGMDDPVGEVTEMRKLPNGLIVGRRRVPLGVIGIIYESRPNVTADAAGLCIKAGNAVILRGGSEAISSNTAITRVLSEAATNAGMPGGAIQLIETTDRAAVGEMLKMNDYIDVIIPRGGAGLINFVTQNATVPTIETGVGNCHTFVDSSADIEKAVNIAYNAKVQRPGVCNAMETLLVHNDIARDFLPLVDRRLKEAGVVIRGCPKTRKIIEAEPAIEEDWDTEFLDLILAVKVVGSIDEAIAHINEHGTKHSEAIITENYTNGMRFLDEVDAAAVYVNASTRFTDGGQFGLGAEIGISTQKLHARGPMGIRELMSTKFVIFGDGQYRE